jgi:hypothetical protein
MPIYVGINSCGGVRPVPRAGPARTVSGGVEVVAVNEPSSYDASTVADAIHDSHGSCLFAADEPAKELNR